MISIRVDKEDFFKRMGRIVQQARNPGAVLAAAGREGSNRLRSHFLEKDRTDANKIAPDRRSHLWREIAHAVEAPVVDLKGNKVLIHIHHPVIAQKIFGGVIRAKRGKALTIPQSPEAYDRAPSVFERETGLKLILIKANGHAFLAARRNDDSKFLQVEYLLTPRVRQEPDPTALPDEKTWTKAILDRADKVLQRQLKEGQKS